MAIQNHLPELIVGALIVLGLMGLGIWQLVSGRLMSKNNKKGKCPAPKCSQVVIETATKVEILEENQGKMFEKIDQISNDVSFIRGKMDKEE